MICLPCRDGNHSGCQTIGCLCDVCCPLPPRTTIEIACPVVPYSGPVSSIVPPDDQDLGPDPTLLWKMGLDRVTGRHGGEQ